MELELITDAEGISTLRPIEHGIGDVTSDAKGSGARYNTGKPPYELIPVQMLADFWARWAIARAKGNGVSDPIAALGALGEFQARRGEDHDSLLDVLCWLGPDGWDECAHGFGYGKRKYAEWNWAKGMPWSVPLACATRHLLALIRGEAIDPESGIPHRGLVFCNVVMLYTFGRTYHEGDDRPASGLL
jgi:hypothetical protein